MKIYEAVKKLFGLRRADASITSLSIGYHPVIQKRAALSNPKPQKSTPADGIFSHIYVKSHSAQEKSAHVPLHVQEKSAQTVATPIFSRSGGTYTGSVAVGISVSTSGATIRYTANETESTGKFHFARYAQEYTRTLIITETTTLTAQASKRGMADSLTATAVYTIVTRKAAATDLVRALSIRTLYSSDFIKKSSRQEAIQAVEFALSSDDLKADDREIVWTSTETHEDYTEGRDSAYLIENRVWRGGEDIYIYTQGRLKRIY
jgi:Chitobiase/beta-hexosaminidase C-terminal domain